VGVGGVPDFCPRFCGSQIFGAHIPESKIPSLFEGGSQVLRVRGGWRGGGVASKFFSLFLSACGATGEHGPSTHPRPSTALLARLHPVNSVLLVRGARAVETRPLYERVVMVRQQGETRSNRQHGQALRILYIIPLIDSALRFSPSVPPLPTRTLNGTGPLRWEVILGWLYLQTQTLSAKFESLDR